MCFVPSDVPSSSRLANAKAQLSLVSGSRQDFTFEWSDSPLVRAAERGEWLLLDRANLCSAAVLDRLNGLFEDGGVLVISEAGGGGGSRVVRPHPRFRIFLAMDPGKGELSAAMRCVGKCQGTIFIIDAPCAVLKHNDSR